MSLNSEDRLLEVYNEIDKLNLFPSFYSQIDKMQTQPKHKHKTVPEKWEYALNKVKENSIND
ncbi:MAG: hypothetical protein GY936_14885 [Ignavibacteriae bacterium]|nr:hypothetical protein [Ignavibacteriota bacterium]